MIKNKSILFGLSLMFLTLISSSIVYSISSKEKCSFEIEENSKTDTSESNNSSEEEVKEAKLMFGSDYTVIYSSVEKIIFNENIVFLENLFHPETHTPPPEFV